MQAIILFILIFFSIVVNEQFSYMAKVLDLCVRVRRWMMFSLEENAKLDVPMTDIESDSDRRVLG